MLVESNGLQIFLFLFTLYYCFLIKAAALGEYFSEKESKASWPWSRPRTLTSHKQRTKKPDASFLQCPPRLHKLVDKYFKPHEEGFTQKLMNDTFSIHVHPSVIVQVINYNIYVGPLSSLHYEWDYSRVEVVLETLKDYLGRLKEICEPGKGTRLGQCDSNFEFIINPHDCGPKIIHDGKTKNSNSIHSQSHRFPFLTVTKCDFENSIPVYQSYQRRDGSFSMWDTNAHSFQEEIKSTRFTDKIPKAVFRGEFRHYSSFDANGTQTPTFISARAWRKHGRGKLRHLALLRPDIFDVQVNSTMTEPFFGKDLHLFTNVQRIDSATQAKNYRFLIYAEGSCGWADRLKFQLFTNSTIFLQSTPCHEYYQDLLEPDVHYIPVDGVFKNLTSQVEWAIANPKIAERIAVNAWNLAKKYLTKDSIQCYMDLVFSKYASLMRYKPTLRAESKLWSPKKRPFPVLNAARLGKIKLGSLSRLFYGHKRRRSVTRKNGLV